MKRKLDDTVKLKALRHRIQTGLDELERGDFVEVDLDNLEEFFASLALEPPDQASSRGSDHKPL